MLANACTDILSNPHHSIHMLAEEIEVEESLLPPPEAVQRLIDANYKKRTRDHKRLIQAAMTWALQALPASHSCKRVKKVVRQLFGNSYFSTMITWADPNLFHEMQAELKQVMSDWCLCTAVM